MSALPFFSIILPTFNRAYMLSRAIHSVIEQTFPGWELIIIDDGSTDNTPDIVKEFSDSRIIYIYQQNAERSTARNNGIDLAKGKYICFLDSDDYYLPNHLENFYKKIKECNEAKAFFFCKLFYETNEILSLPEECEYLSGNNIEYVIQNIISTPQVCIHAQILNEYHFNPTLFIGEDMNLWVHILLKYPLIKTVNRTLILCLHVDRTVNVLVRNSYKYHLNSFRLILKDHAIKASISRKIRLYFISNCYFGMCKHYVHKRKRIKAIIMLVGSYMISPSNKSQSGKYKVNILYCILFNFEKAVKLIE
ncbi:MAG: glycosyltransferase family 2 protein [Bacteroidales bacterium]